MRRFQMCQVCFLIYLHTSIDYIYAYGVWVISFSAEKLTRHKELCTRMDFISVVHVLPS